MKLLIVEDDVELRSLMNEFLTEDGHDVYEAQNGIEAIGLIKANFFDLVISDYQMPKMSGLDLLKICRSERARVSMVWLSGRANPEMFEYAWTFGLYDYLEKPFKRDQIRKTLESFSKLPTTVFDEFFIDYSSGVFNIPYSEISKHIKHTTIRGFLEWCESEKTPYTQMLQKLRSK